MIVIYAIFRRDVYVYIIYTIYSRYDITTLSVYVCVYMCLYICIYIYVYSCVYEYPYMFMQCIDFRMFFLIVRFYYLVSND